MESFNQWRDTARLWLGDTLNSLHNRLWTLDSLIQIIIMLLTFVIVWIVAKESALRVKNWILRKERKHILRLNMSFMEIFFFLYFSTFLWLGVIILPIFGYSASGLQMMASLTTAWGLIRLTSSTIKSNFWSRLIAVCLWSAAALSILGVLGSVTEAMDAVSMTIGKVRVSLLLVIKTIVITGLLLWIIGFVSRILEGAFNKANGLTSSQKVLFYKLSNIFLYGIATFVGLNIIGLDLTALAVFGGALGLGIGFGLQKIFSNLISGIILLMDKSVKPGDVITIGDTYGWVNKLGARYVSVLTRDGKEHLIPNENLISEQVENWSYSDSNIRIHIPVGVAYDSDIHQVREILLMAAKESPRVLKTHPIACLLKEFGDNSVNFELRAWIGDPQQGVSNIKSEIYFRIWDLFKEHGIEIPFPQRDIHLKVDNELRALLKKD